ncbi:MAG: energy transducer TonB [Gemmatimonadetes bacterium]|nr:energy transducer TonB [Gemmatimonadota bacterium]
MVQKPLIVVAAVALLAAGCRSSFTSASGAPPPPPPLLVADPSLGTNDPSAVWLSSAVTQPPVLRSRPRLAVPDSINRKGIQGAVALEYVVDTLGRVEPNIRVISTDHPALVGPAKRMVQGMRYRPGRVRGRAVRVQLGTRVRIGGRAR